MGSRRISNRTIIIGVGIVVFVISYLLNSGPAVSGFEAGQQSGYIAGQALIAAVLTWATLKYVLHRK